MSDSLQPHGLHTRSLVLHCLRETFQIHVLRINGIAIIVTKRVVNAVLGWNLKNNRMTSVRFQGKPFNITQIQVYAPTRLQRWRSWSWSDLWNLQDLLELTPPKDVLFITGDWNANTWSNRQIWPWSTEWSWAKANRVLPRECTGHSKHLLPTTQEKTPYIDITRWSTSKSDCLYSLKPKREKLHTISKNKTGSWLWLRSWTPYCQTQT